MTDLNQLIIKFDYEKNFKNEDFYISKSNQHILKLINIWPKWEKNLLNINGDKYSGKTHLVKIFIKSISYALKSFVFKFLQTFSSIIQDLFS